jgi:hypothetical protein
MIALISNTSTAVTWIISAGRESGWNISAIRRIGYSLPAP